MKKILKNKKFLAALSETLVANGQKIVVFSGSYTWDVLEMSCSGRCGNNLLRARKFPISILTPKMTGKILIFIILERMPANGTAGRIDSERLETEKAQVQPEPLSPIKIYRDIFYLFLQDRNYVTLMNTRLFFVVL